MMILKSIVDDLEKAYGDLLETGRIKEAIKVNEAILMLLGEENNCDK